MQKTQPAKSEETNRLSGTKYCQVAKISFNLTKFAMEKEIKNEAELSGIISTCLGFSSLISSRILHRHKWIHPVVGKVTVINLLCYVTSYFFK
jgi:hypothetical protein